MANDFFDHRRGSPHLYESRLNEYEGRSVSPLPGANPLGVKSGSPIMGRSNSPKLQQSDSPKLSRKAISSLGDTERTGVPLNTPWTLWLDR